MVGRVNDDVLGMLSHLQDALFEAYRDGLRRLQQTHQPGARSRGAERLVMVSSGPSPSVQGAVDGKRVLLTPPVYSPLRGQLDAAVGRMQAALTTAMAVERRLLVVPNGEELDAAQEEYNARVVEAARETSAVSQLLAYRHVVDVALPLDAQERAHGAAEDLLARRSALLASLLSAPGHGDDTEGLRRAAELADEAERALMGARDTWPGHHRDVVIAPPRIRSHLAAANDGAGSSPHSPLPARRPVGRKRARNNRPPPPQPQSE